MRRRLLILVPPVIIVLLAVAVWVATHPAQPPPHEHDIHCWPLIQSPFHAEEMP